MSPKSVELRQQREDKSDKAQAILDAAEQQERNLTAAENVQFNKLVQEVSQLDKQIEDQETLDANQKILRASRVSSNGLGAYGFLPGHNPGGPTMGPRVLQPTLKAFTGDRQQAQRDAYDSGLWLMATLLDDEGARNELVSRRGDTWMSQNTGSAAKGGYLVPTPLQNAILVARAQVGATRRLARIIPMDAPTLSIPKREGGLTVYYPGEESTFTDSDAEFGQLKLEVVKRGVLAYVSNEVQRDAVVSMTDMLATEMGHAFALQEDREFILGDGSSTYGKEVGLNNAIGAGGVYTNSTDDHDAWEDFDLSDFYATMSLIPDQYRVEGQLSWLCSAAFKWQVMDRLTAAVNGAGTTVVVDGQPRMMFLGYPVVLSDRMPTASDASLKSCYFGNFPHSALLGERDEIRIALSEHVAFKEDRLAVRGTTRYDLLLHDMGDADSPGAIVALATNS